jgi:polyisoprenoid-binding protein YceI
MKKILFFALILSSALACKPRTDAERISSEEARAASDASGTEYTLLSESSELKWTGSKPTGEHYGTVDISSGSLQLSESEIISGNFTIDLNTIVVLDLSDQGMNDKLVNHLKSEDFFYVSEYPTGTFEIVSVSALASPSAPETGGITPTHNVTGNLTLRGTTKSISFPARIEMSENRITAQTNPISINRTEWNVNFMSKSIMANLMDNFIDDDMIIELNLEFNKI